MTHDYKRHGTTTLFAALNVHEGTVIGECLAKHRNDEFLSFLKKLDREADKDLDVHLIVDNYATHKHPNVKAWLTKHPRVHLHFTPTSASWVNLVERFFRDITEERLRRGVFHSVAELKEVRISANVTARSGDRDRCAHRSVAGVDYSDRAVTISQIGFGLSHRFASQW